MSTYFSLKVSAGLHTSSSVFLFQLWKKTCTSSEYHDY